MENLTSDEILEAAQRLEHGFAIYDKDLTLLFANKAARQHFEALFTSLEQGDDIRTALGHQTDISGLELDSEARSAVIEKTLRVMKSGEETEFVVSGNRNVRMHHSQTDDGKLIGISIDMTQLKNRQRELKFARREAEAANNAKSEFLAAMSHEIRTPLNGILGMAQALSARNLSVEEQDMVSTVLESSKSLMTILNDILDLSKIEAGKLELSPISGDLRHKLTRLQKFYTPVAEEKGLYFKLVIDPGVPSMLVFDPVRVRQVVSNLVSNALKFTSTGGIIVAVKSTELPGQPGVHGVTVHVSDTGIGIPNDKQDHLFSNFSQADGSTTRQYGGTGLGLAIARRLARMMGGNIKVNSKANKGSVFTFTFAADVGEPAEMPQIDAALELVLNTPSRQPAAFAAPMQAEASQINAPRASEILSGSPAAVDQQGHDDVVTEWIEESTKRSPDMIAAAELVERGTNSLRGLRVLIVDDNAVNRRVARLLIEPQGLVATEAENGREGLDILEREAFDLVLLDMHMPVMDGREAIKFIRASNEPWNKIPVIALTADAMSGDREKCLDLGMDGYVPKPVDQRELFVEILEVMGRAAKQGRTGVTPPVTIDLEAHKDASLDDLFDIVGNA